MYYLIPLSSNENINFLRAQDIFFVKAKGEYLELLEKFLNVIFPPSCGICGKLNSNYICNDCNKILKNIELCKIDIYNNENIIYNKHFYIFKYDGIIRNKIIDYKFNDKSYLYRTFEKILINNKNVCEFIKSYDIIIPVPIHRKRKFERGYNQSELIISKLIYDLKKRETLNTIVDKTSIIKIKNTDKQSLLNKNQREENIRNAYILSKSKSVENIKDKRVLIFDDIYTTGLTANECAKTIKIAEPKCIDILTIAKD